MFETASFFKCAQQPAALIQLFLTPPVTHGPKAGQCSTQKIPPGILGTKHHTTGSHSYDPSTVFWDQTVSFPMFPISHPLSQSKLHVSSQWAHRERLKGTELPELGTPRRRVGAKVHLHRGVAPGVEDLPGLDGHDLGA